MRVPISHTAQQPAPSGATALESLLYPLSPDQLRAEYWQRRPVHLTGWPDRLAGVFDRAALGRALVRQHEVGLSVRVSGDREGDHGAASAHVLVEATDVAEHVRAGTSLCVDPIDRADPRLAALATSFQDELGHVGPVSVKCYYSTPGYGFNTHLDAQVVTTLQIEGTKRWRISRRPGVPHPRDNAFLDTSGEIRYVGRTPRSLRPWETPPVDRDRFIEVVLRPGDVLCLPAGTWHEAKAVGEASLALNFSFAPVDVLGLLLTRIRARLRDEESWRSGIPAGQAADGFLATRLRDLARELQALALDPDVMSGLLGEQDDASLGVVRSEPAAAAHAAALAKGAALTGRRVQCVLGVTDARKSADWYARVIGSEIVSTIPEFGWVEVSTAVPGMTLGLTEMPTTVANRGAVLDFEVDDLERVRGVLAANGVAVTEPATEIAGVARVLAARDLDGNQLMFFEPHTHRSDT